VADICPFRGIRYNQRLITDLSRVICAPSDIITTKMQRDLYRQSEYNFVRLDASLRSASDKSEDSRWQRAAATLEDWLDKGILQIDEVPAIYLHDYYFTYLGKECMRRSIIALVRLEEWDRMIVRRHEKILPELYKTRLSQVRMMKADTSPLLAFFEDQGGRASSLLSTAKLGRPIIKINLRSNADSRHIIWAITEPNLIGQMCDSLAEKPLYIADGHHRYGGALALWAERYASCPSMSRDDPFSFVMMELFSASDPCLIVRAFHRLVRGIPEPVLGGLLTELMAFFEVEEWLLDKSDIWQKVDVLLTNIDPDKPDEVVMVLFGLASDRLFVLRVNDFAATSRAMPGSQSEVYKRFAVSIADQIIIRKLLQITGSKREKQLAFSLDRRDAVQKVSGGRYQLALLLQAARPEQIISIADAGETMPEKSTRFYPKPPTGFVFYRMV